MRIKNNPFELRHYCKSFKRIIFYLGKVVAMGGLFSYMECCFGCKWLGVCGIMLKIMELKLGQALGWCACCVEVPDWR